MAQYRGVDQQEIVSSFAEAMSFIRTLNVGPRCDEIIETFEKSPTWEALQNASSDSELLSAVRDASPFRDFLVKVGRLLYHEALDAEETNGKAYQVYANLTRWNFGLSDYKDYTVDAVLLEEIYNYGTSRFGWPEGWDELSGGNGGRKLKGLNPALKSYTITDPSPELRKMRFADAVDAYLPLDLELREMLASYTAVDEAYVSACGNVGFERDGSLFSGVSIMATEEVAQLVANAYPAALVRRPKENPYDHDVILPEGPHAAAARQSISLEPTTGKPIHAYLIAPKNVNAIQTDEQFEQLRKAVGRFTTHYLLAGEMEMLVSVGAFTDPATGNTRQGIVIHATEDVAKDAATLFAMGQRLAEVDVEIVDEQNHPVPQLTNADKERLRSEHSSAAGRG